MKRGRVIDVRLVVFLLLGAVVNVAVAWGCALWRPLERSYPGDERGWASGDRAEVILKQWFEEQPRFGEHRPELWTERGVGWTRTEASVELLVSRSLLSAGWPFRALRGEMHMTIGPVLAHIDSWPAPNASFGETMIPLRPIWQSLVANTVFYAAVLWLSVRQAAALRRFVRRRCGRCLKCGYDLRHAEHDACPECGGAAKGGKCV